MPSTVPTIIKRLRAADTGAWDAFMEDFSTKDLERAAEWAVHNDGGLLSLIEDELAFRQEG